MLNKKLMEKLLFVLLLAVTISLVGVIKTGQTHAVTPQPVSVAPLPNYYMNLWVNVSPAPATPDKGLSVTATRQAAPPGSTYGSKGPTSINGGYNTPQSCGNKGGCGSPAGVYVVQLNRSNNGLVYAPTSGNETATQIAACDSSHQYNYFVISVKNSSGQTIGQSGSIYENCDPDHGNNNGNVNYTIPTISIYNGCQGYGAIPAGSNLSYNCPDGTTSVQNGVFTNSTIVVSNTTTTQQQQIGLTCNIDLNPLTWLICPIVTAASGMVSYLDTQITTLLDINGCLYFNPSVSVNTINTNPSTGQGCSSGGSPNQSDGYYQAWQSIRTIAIGLVVIGALIMIIAQALGFELFDAYTIKKVLPRMLVAVIGIALSWQLIQLMVQVSDDVGVGIRYLIYAPFTNSLKTISINQTGSSALVIIGGVSLLGLGIFGLLSFVLTAALAVIIGFALLTFREIFIIFMAIFAPLAIACYILPGTQKVWKFWWENFSKALIMFPLIAGFIAIGRVFALTAAPIGNQGVGAVQEVTAMIAYFGPYFLIPFTFKFAGGILAGVGTFASRANRTLSAPLANFRKGQRQQRLERAKSGNLFRGNNAAARFSSGLAQGVLMAPSAGMDPRKIKSKLANARGTADLQEAEELLSKSPEMAAISQDDTLLRATRALATGDTAGAEQILRADGRYQSDAQIRQGMAAADAARRAGSSEAIVAATTMGLSATGTGYENAGQMLEAISAASGGDRIKAARMLGRMKGMAMQSGRGDLGGAGYGTLSTELDNVMRNNGVATQANNDAVALDAFRSNDAVTVARWRNEGVAQTTESVARRIRDLDSRRATLTPEEHYERGQLAGALEKLHSSGSDYAAPQRVESIQGAMTATEVPRNQVRADIKATDRVSKETTGVSVEIPRSTSIAQRLPDARPGAEVEQGYVEQRSTRGANPEDPNMREILNQEQRRQEQDQQRDQN